MQLGSDLYHAARLLKSDIYEAARQLGSGILYSLLLHSRPNNSFVNIATIIITKSINKCNNGYMFVYAYYTCKQYVLFVLLLYDIN